MIKITGTMLKEQMCKGKHVFTGEEGRLVLGLLNSSCSKKADLV
jgi:hypothetical protein